MVISFKSYSSLNLLVFYHYDCISLSDEFSLIMYKYNYLIQLVVLYFPDIIILSLAINNYFAITGPVFITSFYLFIEGSFLQSEVQILSVLLDKN